MVQDVPATIIGIAPPAFVGLRVEAKTDVWLPQNPNAQTRLVLLARLKPRATLEQARAEMAGLYRFTVEERAASSKDPLVRQLSVQVERAGNGLATVRDRFGKPLTVLMTVVGLLLLLACVNIASMLLARAAGREREMAVRISLGASGARLLRQVLTESLMLSTAGTLLGTIVAYFGTSLLLRMLASGREHERILLQVRLDLQVLIFIAGITVLVGILFGAAPAWSAFRSVPAYAMRQSGSVGETRFRRLFGKSLVAAQVSLSILLLSIAALFIANLSNLEHANLGFRRDHVLLVTLDPSASGYTREQLSHAFRELLGPLELIPGVRSVSLSGPTPLEGPGASGVATAEGFQERPEDRRRILIAYVAPKYFETLGTPLLAGRGFNFEDQARPNVAVVDRAFARYYFADRDPIGKHVSLEQVTGVREPRTYEIVGVAGDANYLEIREQAKRTIYLPAFHDGFVSGRSFLIATNIDPDGIATDVTRTIRKMVPSIPVARIITLNDQIDASIVPERLIATLSGFFGALGAVLAGIGLYGLLAYTVARRTGEIGIRMALGADGHDVTQLIMRDVLAMVMAGLAFGVPLAIWGRTLAATMIQDLPMRSVAPIGVAISAIIAIAVLASYVPTRRAARVDPLEALRHE